MSFTWRRIKRLLEKPAGRSLIAAFDFSFDKQYSEKIIETKNQMPGIFELGIDAIIVNQGFARRYVDLIPSEIDIILKVNSWLSTKDELTEFVSLADVLDAIRVDATAILFEFFLDKDVGEQIDMLSSYLSQAHSLSIPVFTRLLSFRRLSTNELASAIWSALDIGSDAVVAPFTEEDAKLRDLIKNSEVPIFLEESLPTGGRVIDFLKRVRISMTYGYSGFVINRKFFIEKNISDEMKRKLIKAINYLVHVNLDVDEAIKYADLKELR